MTLSVAMLLYWFHYSCVLILESDWNEDQARAIAGQKELIFHTVEDVLSRAQTTSDTDRVRDLLDRDLAAVVNMMSECESLRENGRSLESRMLMVNFHITKLRYAVARTSAGPKAHDALRVMSRIVGYLAGELGDHLATARG